MKSFRTTDGAEWEVRVNVLTIKRVEEETGIRLTAIVDDDAMRARLFSDDLRFAETVLAVIRPQLEAAGKTDANFFEALDGTTIEQAAEALLAEIVDFFQEPRKGLLKKWLERHRQAVQKVQAESAAVVAANIETMDMEAMIRSQTHTNSASSSPASAA